MLKKFNKFIKNNLNTKRRIVFIFTLFIFIVSLGSFCLSYFTTTGSFSGSTSVQILEFAPKTNNSTNVAQTITLSDTIINNGNLAPGAEGRFKIDIDFSDVESDSYYKVSYDRTSIPSNLKFYADEDYLTELGDVEGIELVDNTNKMAEHYIYWKWIIDDSAASNANDSLYMNEDMEITFTAYISQMLESNTIIVNGEEKPTGKIYIANTHTGNNRGSFTISTNFDNINSSTNYRIHFNRNVLSSNLHFYSDSSYQNEIDYVSGSFDGVNTSINNTVYWELETDNMSTLSDGLYYIVVLGSW